MNAIILKTLKAVKAKGFDINREILDNVDYCISLIESTEESENTGEIKGVKKSEVIKEADPPPAIDTPAVKPTRKELEDMKYWDIRKEYNITGEKSMNKEELIDVILKKYEA